MMADISAAVLTLTVDDAALRRAVNEALRTIRRFVRSLPKHDRKMLKAKAKRDSRNAAR